MRIARPAADRLRLVGEQALEVPGDALERKSLAGPFAAGRAHPAAALGIAGEGDQRAGEPVAVPGPDSNARAIGEECLRKPAREARDHRHGGRLRFHRDAPEGLRVERWHGENVEGGAVMVEPLNFRQPDVVGAVPDAWLDVTHMVDLADVASDFRLRHGRWLRVATKYVHLTRKFFSDWGIAEYRIVESAGATEAAPAAGAADLIVDITSSGATLQANALRVLEDGLVMKSEANLIISRTAQWTPLKKAQLEALLSIMGGVAPGISTQL